MNLTNKLSKQKTRLSPFFYSQPSITVVSIRVLILLCIQILMLVLTKSFDSLKVVGFSVFGSLCVALLNYFVFKEPSYNIMHLIIQGILIGLFLPSSYPLFIVFVISFFTLFISKCIIFKNLTSWFNPCAVAIVIAWFIGKSYFPQFLVTSDLLSVKNPSVYLIQDGVFPIYNFDRVIVSFLNSKVFSIFHTTVPEGFISILCDNQSVIPAFRFNLITIISSIFIFSDRAFSGIIPSVFLIVYALLVRLFVPFIQGGSFNQGDVLLAMLSSGTIFGSIFMLQSYGTTPFSIVGKIIFGLISGTLYFFIVGCGTSPIGMVYTVLAMNVINILIRAVEEHKNSILLKKLVKTPKLVKAK